MNKAEAQSLVDRWNRKHKPGTEVIVSNKPGAEVATNFATKTRGVAYVDNGVAMVSVEGVKEGVRLEGVKPI